MTIAVETIFAIIEQYLSKYYADPVEDEETQCHVFENEEQFLNFSIQLNEMLINLAEFDNCGGGSFVDSLRSDVAILIIFVCEDNETSICSKTFSISY